MGSASSRDWNATRSGCDQVRVECGGLDGGKAAEERDERIRHLYGSAFGDGQQRGGGGDDAECAAGDG